ncbi:hypothetical protein BGW80DRAFT_1333574 [Lactifluus volemus]|nr:hypothetical protein BGW80DRAFT_1333574 [Lactifluus volemus]
MSTVLSLTEDLVIDDMTKGDHKMFLACQRVCRTFNVIIRNALSLQYMMSLAACGMWDSLPTIVCEGRL